MQTLGTRAKAARDHLGLDRHAVIERMKLTRYATLVEIEEDRVEAGAARLASLASALEVDLAWLVTGDASRAPSWLTESTKGAA